MDSDSETGGSPLLLPADTMAHLKDFLLEQQALQQDYLALIEDQDEARVIDVKEFRRLFGEDWGKSQFWYSEGFAYRFAKALHALCTPATRIAFLCCPTTFVAFQSTAEDDHSGAQPHLLEYDERFRTFAGAQYSYYDLRKPQDGLPEDLLGQVDVAVVDPPYLTRETNELVVQTLKALLRKGGKLVLLTSESVEHLLDGVYRDLGSLHKTSIDVQHANGLANPFAVWNNWEGGADWNV